jgi:hypothetical protein
MKTQLKATWDPKLDTFRAEFLVAFSFVLALLIHYKGTAGTVLMEVGDG